MYISTYIYLVFLSIVVVNSIPRNAFIMDDRYVCTVKKSCLECLKLSQCSWCQTENRCISKDLPEYRKLCGNDTIIDHVDYNLSLTENAECSCSKGEVKQSCNPPGVTDAPPCSGRGTCVCGQCVCNPQPFPDEPTKMVMGEFCEFDNFSCDDPKCNEGPYSIIHPKDEDGSNKTTDEVDIPAL